MGVGAVLRVAKLEVLNVRGDVAALEFGQEFIGAREDSEVDGEVDDSAKTGKVVKYI
jgi:hypothetical protein